MSLTKNILTPSNELGMGNYKIKDAERLIADQECRTKHSIDTSRLSILATIVSVVLELLISILCCCCCKCCRK
jgi:hypothetical protein